MLGAQAEPGNFPHIHSKPRRRSFCQLAAVAVRNVSCSTCPSAIELADVRTQISLSLSVNYNNFP